MNKKAGVWIIVLILLAIFVFAQPPFQEAGGTRVLDIKAPAAEFVERGRDGQLNTHVFNRSNGLVLTNITVSCIVHLYNRTGFHLMNERMGFVADENEFQLNISGDNFSALGLHSYIIQCNGSDTGGFISAGFRVTPDGEDDAVLDNTSGIAIVIFILLITGSLFLLSAKEKIVENKYVNFVMKRSFIVIGIYLMILNSAIMATLANSSNILVVNEMFTYMNLFGYLGYPAIVYLLFSTVIQTMRFWRLDKKQKRTGDDDGET